jgi:hypothetical protein
MTINELRTAVEATKARSAWSKGVKVYAYHMLENLEFDLEYGYKEPDIFESPNLLRKALLNGASDWKEFSYGGCSLIYNGEIAEILCTPSELKKTKNGKYRPNANETWLDVQARALAQACNLIINTAYEFHTK